MSLVFMSKLRALTIELLEKDPNDKRFPRYGNREIKNHILRIYNYALCFQED